MPINCNLLCSREYKNEYNIYNLGASEVQYGVKDGRTERQYVQEGGHRYSIPVGYARRMENTAHTTATSGMPDSANRTHISEKWQASFPCAAS